MQLYNFNAGPSHLPQEVLNQAQEAIQDFKGTGLSILEFPHRNPLFSDVMEEARSLAHKLMGL